MRNRRGEGVGKSCSLCPRVLPPASSTRRRLSQLLHHRAMPMTSADGSPSPPPPPTKPFSAQHKAPHTVTPSHPLHGRKTTRRKLREYRRASFETVNSKRIHTRTSTCAALKTLCPALDYGDDAPMAVSANSTILRVIDVTRSFGVNLHPCLHFPTVNHALSSQPVISHPRILGLNHYSHLFVAPPVPGAPLLPLSSSILISIYLDISLNIPITSRLASPRLASCSTLLQISLLLIS
ncbi:hypothetical protein BDN71DRAFT_1173972 [Pleurotus eryngii]|uniref:Uncharacterized protein n=1 Tax=Pleurotus eryngii TaxID=5323 RepID=A0A9P5ZVZ1_PLEER|nr:hypothetical protein BDN71DRAFT_1173972 [Pleurotus eryngii]